MKFSDPVVSAAKDSVEPALRFETKLEMPGSREVVLSVGGALFTADGKRVATLIEDARSRLDMLPLSLGPAATEVPQSVASVAVLTATLSPRLVDHLARSRDPRGDLHLNVSMAIEYASPAAKPLRVELGEPAPNNPKLYPIAFQPGIPKEEGRTIWHLLTDGAMGALTINRIERTVGVKVHGMDWLHDFAPVLGLGRTVVVEIPQARRHGDRWRSPRGR